MDCPHLTQVCTTRRWRASRVATSGRGTGRSSSARRAPAAPSGRCSPAPSAPTSTARSAGPPSSTPSASWRSCGRPSCDITLWRLAAGSRIFVRSSMPCTPYFWWSSFRKRLVAGVGDARLPLLGSAGAGADEKVPWLTYLSHRALWACIISHFCQNNCFFILLSWLPTYFHDNFPEVVYKRDETKIMICVSGVILIYLFPPGPLLCFQRCPLGLQRPRHFLSQLPRQEAPRTRQLSWHR